MCCEKNLRQKYCRLGVRTYKIEKTCPSEENKFLNELEVKCCVSCHLGAQLGELKVPCLSIDLPVEEEVRRAMLSCCSEINPVRKIDKVYKKTRNNYSTTVPPFADYEDYDNVGIPTPSPDNLCDLLPGQLCAQICVPTHGSYYCKCEEGFVLMEDQKTCQKENSQPLAKQKQVSTIAPRIIVPNPEKPVPLVKPKVTTSPTKLPTSSIGTIFTNPKEKKTCSDFNPCEQICVDDDDDENGGVKCECRYGFVLDANERNCSDVNECLNKKNTCDLLTEKCVNEIGGYTCVKIKKPNVVSLTTLTEVNLTSPAVTNFSTTTTSTTTTTTTTYEPPMELAVVPKDFLTGECPLGFEEIDGKCTDLNECNYDRFPEVCDSDFECINTPGSYLCRLKFFFFSVRFTLRKQIKNFFKKFIFDLDVKLDLKKIQILIGARMLMNVRRISTIVLHLKDVTIQSVRKSIYKRYLKNFYQINFFSIVRIVSLREIYRMWNRIHIKFSNRSMRR